MIFHHSSDAVGGTRLPNGTCSGVMGLIQRKEADFVLGMMVHATARMEITDTAGILEVENHLAIMDSAKNLQNDLTGIFQCFSAKIWMLVMATYIIHVFCNSLFKKQLSLLKNAFYAAIDHFGILVGQGKL